MKHLLVAVMGLLLSASLHAETECEDAVDMADSLDFHSMHVECNDEPVTLYDPKSKSNFLSKKGKVITAYTDGEAVTRKLPAVAKSAEPLNTSYGAGLEAEPSNAGVTFNIREPFTLTGGPQSALSGLYVQMAQYCSRGWSKEKEWVVSADTGYLLHYQFTCAE